ncbi:MAG: type II toxin-antitoxin system HicB family antitoxin [bacterium]|jgi:predicted RNase H-like HicB family nuclease
MLKERYIFPAVFEPDDGAYCITFPDLPGIVTTGDSIEEALYMARDAMSLHLWGMEDDGDPIPEPTPPSDIPIPEGGFVSLIEVYMPPYRNKMATKAVNRMVTLPKWLDSLAKKENVNFSQILQNSLKEQLGIYDYAQVKKRST